MRSGIYRNNFTLRYTRWKTSPSGALHVLICH